MKKRIPAATIWTAIVLLMLTGTLAYGFDPLDLAKLKKTKFCPYCDLSGVNLRRANLREAYMSMADLKKANLSMADLRGAYLGNADLENANLRGANLRGADLSWAHLKGTDLRGVNLKGAYLVGATWTDGSRCDLTSKGQCNKCKNWSIKDSKCLDPKPSQQ